MAGALGSKPDGGMSHESGSSKPQNTSVGSGSRPGAGSVPIKTSAPKDPRTMDRDPPAGWLK